MELSTEIAWIHHHRASQLLARIHNRVANMSNFAPMGKVIGYPYNSCGATRMESSAMCMNTEKSCGGRQASPIETLTEELRSTHQACSSTHVRTNVANSLSTRQTSSQFAKSVACRATHVELSRKRVTEAPFPAPSQIPDHSP